MIGDKIRYFRKKQGLTLEKLSEGICSISYLSKIERGEKANTDIINLLCKKLGILSDEELNLKKENLYNDIINCYTYIKKNKLINKDELNILHENCLNQDDPNILGLFYLVKFRYLLLKIELPECDILINDINLLKPYFNDESRFYYYKFYGLYLYFKKSFTHSLEYYKLAEYISNKISIDMIEIADVYFQISLIYIRLNQIAISIDYCRKASSIYENRYRLKDTAECQMILGINYRKIKAYEQAHYHLENIYHISKEINNLTLLSSYHHNLGYLFSCENKLKEAIENYTKAINIRTKQNNIEKNIPTIFLLSKEMVKSGERKKALYWIKRGLDLASNNREYVFHFNILKLTINKNPDLKSFLIEAINFFKNANLHEYASEYSETLAELYSKKFNYKEASKYYCLANELKKLM